MTHRNRLLAGALALALLAGACGDDDAAAPDGGNGGNGGNGGGGGNGD